MMVSHCNFLLLKMSVKNSARLFFNTGFYSKLNFEIMTYVFYLETLKLVKKGSKSKYLAKNVFQGPK